MEPVAYASGTSGARPVPGAHRNLFIYPLTNRSRNDLAPNISTDLLELTNHKRYTWHMSKDVAERVRDHAAKQRRRGLAKVAVWVPRAEAERLKSIAAGMRAKSGVPLPTERERHQQPKAQPEKRPDSRPSVALAPAESNKRRRKQRR